MPLGSYTVGGVSLGLGPADFVGKSREDLVPSPYDYASGSGYGRAVADWKNLPTTTTPITDVELDHIEQAVADLKGVTFNVRDFGAKGDGLTNDSSAIQLAIEAAYAAGGGVVWFPDGTYLLLTALNLRSGVVLGGAGRDKVTLKAGGVFDFGWYGMVRVHGVQGTATQISDCRIHDITIDADNQTNALPLSLAGVERFRASGCVFKNADGATTAGGVIVSGGTFAGAYNIPYASSNDVRFVDCEFGPSTTDGVRVCGGRGASSPTLTNVGFYNCYAHDNDLAGIENGMESPRVIQGVRIRDCRFERNGLDTGGAFQAAHVNDGLRNGWVDLEVAGCHFGAVANLFCGGVADHRGRAIHIHDNYFKLDQWVWPIALGEDRSALDGIEGRTWFAWVEDNYFENCGPWDFDSCRHVYIRRNVWYRNKERALGSFGHHFHTVIEDNAFIEGGQDLPAADEFCKAAISLARGHIVRGNIFRDDQIVPTQIYGVYEITGDPDEGQGLIEYDQNDFANTTNPVFEEAAYDDVRRYFRNKGFDPQGTAAITVGVSPFTYTAGAAPEAVYIRGGTVSDVSKNSRTIFAATGCTVMLEPGESIVVTYSVLPTMEKDRK